MTTDMSDRIRFDSARHEYWINDINTPSVSKIIKSGEKGDYQIPAHYAERGTSVHKAIELYQKGWPMQESDDPALEAWVRFSRCVDQVEGVEVIVHEGTWYAGTIDLIASVDGIKGVWDLKTGQKASWHVEQIAAYQKAYGRMQFSAGCIYYDKDQNMWRVSMPSRSELERGWLKFWTLCQKYHEKHMGSEK